jgi:ABC-type dipeptide/oligopeptide/nickel transport system ATPase component
MLRVENLTIQFKYQNASKCIVRDVCFHVPAGQFTAIVGESGSGKSVTALAITGFSYKSPGITTGKVTFDGNVLYSIGVPDHPDSVISDEKWKLIRGNKISYITQEPRVSLNPLFTVGAHLEQQLSKLKLSKKARRQKAMDILESVNLNPRRTYSLYPYQLSGGMCQLATIAIAIAAEPSLIIADEPTTFLDARFQESILGLLYQLQKQTGTTILFITHSFHIVEKLADKLIVMFNGSVVEEISKNCLYSEQWIHPYTKALLNQESFIGNPGAAEGSRCAFAERCSIYSPEICNRDTIPDAVVFGEEHICRCWRSRECIY